MQQMQRFISLISFGAIMAAILFVYQTENDRAVFTISGFGFEPFPFVANKRSYAVVSIKNTGRNYGTIEAAAFDREDKLPMEPTYDPADIAPVQIESGKEQEVISDLGDKPLIFTPQEVSGLLKGSIPLKIAGFVEYSDRYWLGRRIVGFCDIWNASIGSFTACSEKTYTYGYRYLFSAGIQVREIPMITLGRQTASPTTLPRSEFPDPKIENAAEALTGVCGLSAFLRLRRDTLRSHAL
jgi:hypothetical protein